MKLPYLSATLLLLLPAFAVAKDDVEEDLVPLLERAEETIYESDKAVRLSVGGTAGVAYNDNIYRSDGNEESDFIGIFRPGVRLKTDLKPYQVDIEGRVEVGEYFSESENSYVDTDLKARVGYDITPTTNVYVAGRHQKEHVAIGAFTDTPNSQAAEPTDYMYGELSGGVKVDEPVWMAHVNTGIDFFDYDNSRRRDGTQIINDDRDRDENHVTARVGYKLQEESVLYVEGTYNNRRYDSRVDSTLLFPRDSDGIEALVGVKLGNRRSSPLFVDLGVGYLQQDYDAAILPEVTGVALRGNVQWRPDDLWRVRGNVTRDVRETSTTGASGYLQTRIGTEATYQLLDTLKVGGKLRYTQNDFEVNQAAGGVKRTDNIYDGGIFADYNFHEDYVVGGEYLHVNRDSDRASNDYASNVFLLRLGVLY
ncbi:MAG: outer membrane beta-barrel protein [Rickettsiales bacterium]|nr:outer membrane beta-barrel protein [Rickettsiales bacterium]